MASKDCFEEWYSSLGGGASEFRMPTMKDVKWKFRANRRNPPSNKKLKKAAVEFVHSMLDCANCYSANGYKTPCTCVQYIPRDKATVDGLISNVERVAFLKIKDRDLYNNHIISVMRQCKLDGTYPLPVWPPSPSGADLPQSAHGQICKGLWLRLNIVTRADYQDLSKIVILEFGRAGRLLEL